MMHRYILDDDKQPILCPDLIRWSVWFERDENRLVALAQVGDYTISTVFSGIDHVYDGGIPLLFESMVFNGKGEPVQFDETTEAQKASIAFFGFDLFHCSKRYATWAGAEDGHAHIIRMIKSITGRPEQVISIEGKSE
jgi:hypothetical protein